MTSSLPVLPLSEVTTLSQQLRQALDDVVLGQPHITKALTVALLAKGHVLLEGLPGTAKTTLAKTVTQLTGLDFKRIQLTPDLLPAEVTGTHMYDLESRSFQFRPGPVFCDLLLADEINRTPPKTQSALLEAMEEGQVTADGETRPLSEHFTVLATLNPIEFEGTYPLPEAQLDRFMMKLVMSYPTQEAERQMLQDFSTQASLDVRNHQELSPVLSAEQLAQCRAAMAQVTVKDRVLDYILSIAQTSRQNRSLSLGTSPRAALALLAASRACAVVEGRDFVTPDDVKTMAEPVLIHRLQLSPEAQLDGLYVSDALQHTLGQVTVPR